MNMILSTWSFSESILNSVATNLCDSASALDLVETCARMAEADESIDSVGYGGYPDAEGRCTLDAAVMLSPNQSGAVCAIERHQHPVSIARLVMEQTSHTLLAGPLADAFADAHGLESSDLLARPSKEKWLKWKEEHQPTETLAPYDTGTGKLFGNHDTIGTLAIDTCGTMAGACSTSGMAWKVPGRVGDSPIIGHGLYVDPKRGAATATGHGELISGICSSFLVVELMGRGATPIEAIQEMLQRVASSYEITPEHQVACIAMTPDSEFAAGALRAGFSYVVYQDGPAKVMNPEFVLSS